MSRTDIPLVVYKSYTTDGITYDISLENRPEKYSLEELIEIRNLLNQFIHDEQILDKNNE